MRCQSIVLASLLATTVAAQSQCMTTQDDGLLITNVTTGGVPLGYKLQAVHPMRVIDPGAATGFSHTDGLVIIL